MSNLETGFDARIRSALSDSHDLGYHPTRFEQMLESSDAVHLAKKLVASGDLQDGLKKLKALGRLDLSMEQIMLEPQFSSLFSKQELTAAEWRLKQL